MNTTTYFRGTVPLIQITDNSRLTRPPTNMNDNMDMCDIDNYQQCKRCGDWVKKSERAVIDHLNTKHGRTTTAEKTVGKLCCTLCTGTYTCTWSLNRHNKTIHNCMAPPTQPELVVIPHPPKHEKKKTYRNPNITPENVKFRIIMAPSPYSRTRGNGPSWNRRGLKAINKTTSCQTA